MRRHRWVPPALVLACVAPLALHALPVSTAAGVPRCDGVAATIVGTSRGDRLTGTAKRDVVVGLGGDDVVEGLGGDDLLCGGPGADRLVGGPGDDRLFGGADKLDEGPGGSYLAGDVLAGGPGDDLLHGGGDRRRADQRRRPDTYSWAESASPVRVDLSGKAGQASGEGTDRIVLGPASRVVGSAYGDTISGSSGPDTVDAGPGNDTIATGRGRDTVYPDGEGAADGDDTVLTGPGADFVSSLSGRDSIATGDGADFVEAFSQTPTTVDAGSGDDYVGQNVTPGRRAASRGGPGDDVVVFYGRLLAGQAPTARFTVDYRTGRTRASGDVAATGAIDGFEGHRFVGALRWQFFGVALPERVWAIEGGPLRALMGKGNDSATGSPRDDVIDGGPGTDTGYRGGGKDTCTSVERGDC